MSAIREEITLNLLGESITVRTDQKKDYLIQIENQLKSRYRQMGQKNYLKDPLKTAILLNIYLLDEINQLKKSQESAIDSGETEKIQEITLKLIESIDRSLE